MYLTFVYTGKIYNKLFTCLYWKEYNFNSTESSWWKGIVVGYLMRQEDVLYRNDTTLLCFHLILLRITIANELNVNYNIEFNCIRLLSSMPTERVFCRGIAARKSAYKQGTFYMYLGGLFVGVDVCLWNHSRKWKFRVYWCWIEYIWDPHREESNEFQ